MTDGLTWRWLCARAHKPTLQLQLSHSESATAASGNSAPVSPINACLLKIWPRAATTSTRCAKGRLYRRLLPLRFLEISAAMMTPAAVISGGSNFSINSVIMQSRAVSNRALRLSQNTR